MTTNVPSLCVSCKHLDRHPNSIGYNGTPKCRAFPGAIPADIYYRGADHREIDHRQDNDVTHAVDPGRETLLQIWFEYARQLGVT